MPPSEIRTLTLHERTLFRLLALGLFLSGCASSGSTSPAAAQPTDDLFEQFEVVTGVAERQTLLVGFLLGGATAELAVLQVDDNGDRRLSVYTKGPDTWEMELDATLRPEVLFVDIANIDGRDRLITYQHGRSPAGTSQGRLSWFDPVSKTQTELAAVTSSFSPPRGDEVPHVDMTRDLNGDGRDDLVVPDSGGFWILLQKEGGAFSAPVQLGPPADLSGILGADGYRYDPWSVSRIFEVDINRDGRGDLAFWKEDHFEVHLQGQRGDFSPLTETFTTEVDFDSDDVFSLAKGEMSGTVLHSLADVNGDDIADLVIFSLEGRRASEKRSAYEVHFGQASPDGGTEFPTHVGARLQSEGSIQIGMNRLDLGPDGRAALMITTVEVRFLEGSVWKKFKGAMGDDVVLHLEFHALGDDLIDEEPDAIHRIALDGVPSHREPGWVPLDILLRGPTHEHRQTQEIWPRAFNRTLLVGDVTGDDRSDLLLEAEFRELRVFAGVPGAEMFASQSQSVAVSLFDGEYTWLADLDKDGKKDILMHQPFTQRNPHGAPTQPPGTEPNRVTILIGTGPP